MSCQQEKPVAPHFKPEMVGTDTSLQVDLRYRAPARARVL